MYPQSKLLRLTEWVASSDNIAAQTIGMRKLEVADGGQAWSSCDPPATSICTRREGGSAAVIVVRGQTLIEIAGNSYSEAEMLKVATSLQLLPTTPQQPAFPTLPPLPSPVPTEAGDSLPLPMPSPSP